MDQGPSPPVLLCVDDEVALKARKLLLEKKGLQVLAATRAHEALEIFRTHYVDIVLIEHVMPASIDGPTLAATMKMLKPGVPVAVYSADWEPSPEDLRFADIFVTKLVSPDELLHTIEKLLKKVKP